MNTTATAGDAATRLAREPLSRQLEEALRLDIVEGILRPGERLRVAAIERRYGVSATPLREALQHLAADGLVVLDPGYGARVAPASITDLRDIYLARSVMEGEALRLSMNRADDQWRTELKGSMDRLRTASLAMTADAGRDEVLLWSKAHRDFHLALFASCPSQWLLRFIMTLYEHSERYRMLTRDGSPRRDTLGEHEQIFVAAIGADTDAAVESLRHHLQSTVAVLDQALEQAPTVFPAVEMERSLARRRLATRNEQLGTERQGS